MSSLDKPWIASTRSSMATCRGSNSMAASNSSHDTRSTLSERDLTLSSVFIRCLAAVEGDMVPRRYSFNALTSSNVAGSSSVFWPLAANQAPGSDFMARSDERVGEF